ncbi:MAG TPA: hypothetical protein VMZ00_17215 [Sporichthya sp.]|nr:hypothetical protein [Sporichthya sp.]
MLDVWDRTGLVIGLLLSALGVPDGIVAEDNGINESACTEDERARMIRKGLEMGPTRPRSTN